jgi:hypothetical protein
MLNYIFNFDKIYYDELPTADKIYSWFSFGRGFANITSLGELIVLLFNRIVSKYLPDFRADSVYGVNASNENGDQEKNVLLNGEILLNTKASIPPVLFNESIKKEFIAFVNWCNDNKIKLFISFPSVYDKWFYDSNVSQLAEQIISFCQDNNIEILGEYTDFVYEFSDMYDMVYHLNSVGMEKRTWKIIELLQQKSVANIN